MASQPWLLVLDFDHTVIDVNSDTHVIEEASAKVALLQKGMFGKMQWTDLMSVAIPQYRTTLCF